VVPRHHYNKQKNAAHRPPPAPRPSVITMAESNPHYKKEYKALEGEKRAALKKVKGTTKGKKAKDEAALYVAGLLLVVRSFLASLLRSFLVSHFRFVQSAQKNVSRLSTQWFFIIYILLF
jgi:hypothetical protein